MKRKVFLSFLGYSNYAACKYRSGEYVSEEVRFVQEAILDFLIREEQWCEDDVAYILLTKGAQMKNWDDKGYRDRQTGELLPGLRTRLVKMNLPMPIVPICPLPDGNNEMEIWKIFSYIFNLLEEGDELYFDLTHGFRYLPMLVLVLGNYAKFLKNITVKHITYGNYEGRNFDTNEAPLIDLLPLSSLQDWTYAGASFIESGEVRRLVSLSENVYRPLLKESKGMDADASGLRMLAQSLKAVVEELQTCRGMSIISATNTAKLSGLLDKLESTIIEPLNPIIEEIKSKFSTFRSNPCIGNGYEAALWCYENRLYQQAATILQEAVVSAIAERNGIAIDDEEKRELVNKAFAITFNNIAEHDWVVKDEVRDLLESVLRDNVFKDVHVVRAFDSLTQVRNDFNHSGMRKKRVPLKPKQIIEKLSKCLQELRCVFGCVLINLSNHPYEDWSKEQKDAAEEYGIVIDYPFPKVNPELGETEIAEMAKTIVKDIVVKYSPQNITIHLMGEFNLCYALVDLFRKHKIRCIASTSNRDVTVSPADGTKTSVFRFVKFRTY